MKIAIIGGTGAIGSIFGGRLQQAGNQVTLFDVAQNSVDKIKGQGLNITIPKVN